MEMDLVNAILSLPDVKNLIHNKKVQFDIVLTEHYFEAFFAFAKRYNCPLIGISSYEINVPNHCNMGDPVNPTLYPEYFLPYENLTLFERVFSSLSFVVMRLFRWFVVIPNNEEVVAKHFGRQNDTSSIVDLMLINTNPVFSMNRPLSPAVIPIGGGMHITENRTSNLTQELRDFLDYSKQGVVYISFGTNVQMNKLNGEFKTTVLKAFSKLELNVLWKYERHDFVKVPKNVKFSGWVSQIDVLKHPNVKLFITQGGLQSLEESIINTVPLIVIPFFGDQIANARKVEASGYGNILDHKSLTEDKLMEAINEVLNNAEFRDNVVNASKQFFSNPMTGLERAVWWTEYAIRHKGAKHLRNSSVDLPLYTFFFLDMLCALVTALFLVFYVIKKAKLNFTSDNKLKSM